MSLAPGTRLGPYEIIAPLGAGGMGEVYRARDSRLGRDVAVKVLPQHLSSNAEVRARFEREARTVSSLNHPHICVLHDIGRAPGVAGSGDTDYLVMELVEGETLAARLARGALSTADVLRIGEQIADALARAHRAGIVHRDLKPGNVMLSRSGAKLMDFGLARATGMAGPAGGSGVTAAALTQSPTVAQPLTAEGTLLGTFQYMSPEQLEGKEADARSDIWALGCVLYEMATGHRAFEGSSQASLIAAILERRPAPITIAQPMSPAALDRLVQSMLAKDPDDRVQTAQDVKLQLEWIRSDASPPTGGATAPAAPASVAASRGRAGRLVLWLLPVLVGVAAFLAGRGSAPGTNGSPVQFERKTFSQQAIFGARFMPDGKTLVLSAAPAGNDPHLFVIRSEYPEPQRVSDASLHLLGISSRGELLVLNHARFSGHHRLFRGTLARMPLEGGAPRDIMDDVREADWAPDGERFAVIHDVGGKDRLEFPVGRVLYESAGYLSDVRVSPEGDLIAFMEHPKKFDDRGSVIVVDLSGKVRVVSGGYWGLEGLAWATDGRSVLFSATTNGSDYAVTEIDLAGRRRPTRQNIGLVTMHDIARDGTWAVTRDDVPTRIVFRAAGAREEVDLSWLDAARLPVLSADAKTLTFTDESVAGGPNYTVTMRPTTGGPIVRLGEGLGQELSRDGKSVLAIVYGTPQRLMSYPIGAGQATRLDQGGLGNMSSASWMPDSRRVLVSGNEPGKAPRCFLLDPASGALEPVGPEGIWEGVVAPDGGTFIARSQTGWAVYPISGTRAGRPVPSMTSRDYLIRWDPDGSAVYCYQRSEVPSAVERIETTTGRRETIATLGDPKTAGLLAVVGVSMADDTRSMAYCTWLYTSVLYTVGRVR